MPTDLTLPPSAFALARRDGPRRPALSGPACTSTPTYLPTRACLACLPTCLRYTHLRISLAPPLKTRRRPIVCLPGLLVCLAGPQRPRLLVGLVCSPATTSLLHRWQLAVCPGPNHRLPAVALPAGRTLSASGCALSSAGRGPAGLAWPPFPGLVALAAASLSLLLSPSAALLFDCRLFERSRLVLHVALAAESCAPRVEAGALGLDRGALRCTAALTQVPALHCLTQAPCTARLAGRHGLVRG